MLNKNLILGLVFFILFIGVAIVIQKDVLGGYKNVDVYIATRDILPNEKVTTSDLKIFSLERELRTDDMIFRPSDVVGKAATTKIPENSFVTYSALDEEVLWPTENHSFYPIPNEWILHIQGSVRRYDQVNVIAVPERSNDPTVQLPIISEPILQSVPVVFVKNNSNKEVLNEEGDDNRLLGTSRPTQIELSLTLDQFKRLEKTYMDGYSFVFSY